MPFSNEITSADKLSPNMTLKEVLALAMGFEETAYQFYGGLVDKVRTEIQPLIRELAAEEKKHYELLECLASDENLVDYLRHRTKTPPTTEVFSHYIDLPLDPEELIEDSLLEYAKGRERIAYEHYACLAETTPRGPLKDLFMFLHDEEAGHTKVLEARWAQLFSVF